MKAKKLNTEETRKLADYVRNGAGELSRNQIRMQMKIPKVNGWYHCPGNTNPGEEEPCTYGPKGTVYRTRRAQPLGKHRHDEHNYVSPDPYAANKRKHILGEGVVEDPDFVEVTGKQDPAYYIAETGKLLPDSNDMFHCPEFIKKTGKPCPFIHTHATSTGWHRRKAHGIVGINAHRTKKKPNAEQVREIMRDADEVRSNPKPRKAWGTNRIEAAQKGQLAVRPVRVPSRLHPLAHEPAERRLVILCPGCGFVNLGNMHKICPTVGCGVDLDAVGLAMAFRRPRIHE